MRAVPVYFDPVMLRHDTGPYHPETAHRVEVVVDTLRQDGRRDRGAGRSRKNAEGRRARARRGLREAARGPVPRARRRARPGRSRSSTAPTTRSRPPRSRRRCAPCRSRSRRRTRSSRGARPRSSWRRGRRAITRSQPSAMGFCFLNTIAIAAKDLIEHHGVARVLVADFDVHHGNGTQELFWEDGRVAYLSVHRYPFYPGTGAADEEGTGRGRGATKNVPLPAGSGRRGVRGRLRRGAREARRALPARGRPRERGFRRPPVGSDRRACASRRRASPG